jgi:carbon-monoxide dehydrogenase iron sulfur subunit
MEREAQEKHLSRRTFLKGMGTGAVAGAVVTATVGCGTPAPESGATPTMASSATSTPIPTTSMAAVTSELTRSVPVATKVVIADPSICRGCATCVAACSLFHGGISGRNMSRVDISRDFLAGRFVQNVCRQCEGPECMLACPVEGAMYIDPTTGARMVDEDKCLGCGRCVDACQFGAVKLDLQREVALKCDLCGGDPQCVAVCPTGALSYQDWQPGT